jgi:hypothetical protein
MMENENSSHKLLNNTFRPHEWWLVYGGSEWWSDAIGIFAMPPITIAGMLLNLAACLVLHFSAAFSKAKIDTYLKFNFLNGFVCNAIGILYLFTYRLATPTSLCST